jgi:glycosyltransferase 2 family protein
MKHRIPWRYGFWLLWIGGLFLAGWSLHEIPLSEAWSRLRSIGATELGVLVALNGAVILVFSLRWYILARSMGAPGGLLAFVSYRLAAFGVNYFTPGPQFGGEPLQVALLTKKQSLPASDAVAVVTLDKLLELALNFGFLIMGLVFIASLGILENLAQIQVVVFVLTLFCLPTFYLGAIWRGFLPISGLLSHLARRLNHAGAIQSAYQFVYASEDRTAHFCQQHPVVFLSAGLLSLIGWAIMILEFWLSLIFLGIPASLLQSIVWMTTARLAFLSPTPGGLGALEAASLLTATVFGFGPATGLSLILYIRMRDLLIGVSGLGLIPTLISTTHQPVALKPHGMIILPEQSVTPYTEAGSQTTSGASSHGKN